MKYGDKVKLSENINNNHGVSIELLNSLKGKILTISKVFSVGFYDYLPYQLEEGDENWFSEDMLEPVETSEGLTPPNVDSSVQTFAENLGKTIDDAIKENPILMKLYADLQKKYNELDIKYKELEQEKDYLLGKCAAYEKILGIGSEEE